MKKVETTNTFVTGVFPDTLAINSTGAGTQDGFEFIAEYLNNMVVGPQQAIMDYAAGNTNPDVGTVGVPNGVTEAAGFSQLIESIHKGFGIGPGVYKPYGKFLDPSVTGDRILLLSNQGVLISSFPELVAATYVGDGNNPTAPFFYKSVLADGLTRDTAGPFFILPPANPTYQRKYSEDGGDFTVTQTGGAGAWSDTGSIITPFQTSNGQWYADFNMSGSYASGTLSSFGISISGITFKNVSNFDQSVTFYDGGSAGRGSTVYFTCRADPNASTITMLGAASVTLNNRWGFSRVLALESEPTFADGHTFPWGITY